MSTPSEFVLSLARALVDNPDKVETCWVDNPQGGLVKVNVPAEDRGKLIGKSGRTIQSIRHLTTAAFAKNNNSIGVELAE